MTFELTPYKHGQWIKDDWRPGPVIGDKHVPMRNIAAASVAQAEKSLRYYIERDHDLSAAQFCIIDLHRELVEIDHPRADEQADWPFVAYFAA